MVTTAKRLVVVRLAALLLAGGGTAALDWDAAALATGASKPTGGVDAQDRDGGRQGEEIPTERDGDGPTTQAGKGGINAGGDC